MQRQIVWAAANTLAPALAELTKLGFEVTRRGESYRGDRSGMTLEADDVLQLLGLAYLVQQRSIGATQATDVEVEALLRLEGET